MLFKHPVHCLALGCSQQWPLQKVSQFLNGKQPGSEDGQAAASEYSTLQSTKGATSKGFPWGQGPWLGKLRRIDLSPHRALQPGACVQCTPSTVVPGDSED